MTRRVRLPLQKFSISKRKHATWHIVARLPFGRDERVEFAETAAVFTAYGITEAAPQALYLVRPDGYVAWRAAGLDVEGCRRFLARLGAI